MGLVRDKKAISPVVGVMLMLVVTVILAAVVSSYSGGLPSDESKASQLAISAEAKQNDYVLVKHDSGDPVNLNSIEIRTFIPEGTYSDMNYKVPTSALKEIGNGNGVLETGESIQIDWKDAFATSSWGTLMAPNPGEKVVIEIYEKGGEKPIAKTTAVVRP